MTAPTLTASDLARRTPAGRNRYIDLLRVLALLVVVVGHTMMAAVVVRDGELIIGLNGATWLQVLTWALQVMPIFFIVGGFSNAASWQSARAKGTAYGDWLRARARRLVNPAIVFIVVGIALAVSVGLTGIDPELLSEATQAMAVPIWFLAVYMLVVATAPVMLRLHERYRLAVPAALTVVVVVFDIAARGYGIGFFGWANFVPVWLAVHQLGFFWQDGSLERLRPHATKMAGVIVAAITALTFFGPYPVAMVGVRAADGSNNTPPTVLMVVLGLFQLAVAIRLERRVQRVLQRPKAWTAVITASGVAMTVYLWHMTALILTIGALWVTNNPLMDIEPMTVTWFLTRPVFIALVALVLAPFVLAFSRADRPTVAASVNLTTPRAFVGALLAGAGLARFAFWGLFWPAGPAGIPLIGIALLGSGAILLALRSRGPAPVAAA